MGRVQQHMHLRQFNRRHGAAGTTTKLVGDVTPARATQHTPQRSRRAGQHRSQALTAGQSLFLHILDGRHGCKNLQQHRRVKARACRWGYVLQHDWRSGHGCGNSLEVADLLGHGLQVGRSGNHQRSRALSGGQLGQTHRKRHIGAAHTGHHRHSARRFGKHLAHQRRTFRLAECGHLARHTGKSHAVDAASDQVAHQGAQPRGIGHTSSVKGCGQHRIDAGDQGRR